MNAAKVRFSLVCAILMTVNMGHAYASSAGGGDPLELSFISGANEARSSISDFKLIKYRQAQDNSTVVFGQPSSPPGYTDDGRPFAKVIISGDEDLDQVLKKVAVVTFDSQRGPQASLTIRRDLKDYLNELLLNVSFRSLLSKKGVDPTAVNEKDMLVAFAARSYLAVAGIDVKECDGSFFEVLADRVHQKTSADLRGYYSDEPVQRLSVSGQPL